jgi:hypothetical protein
VGELRNTYISLEILKGTVFGDLNIDGILMKQDGRI